MIELTVKLKYGTISKIFKGLADALQYIEELKASGQDVLTFTYELVEVV